MKKRTRIKFCGITSVEDARAAVEAGADAIGLVFYAPSSRFVSIEQAQEIVQAIPAFVSIVGLFVDESTEQVKTVIKGVRLDLLQFHGDEEPGYCASFAQPYMKALRMKPGLDVLELMSEYVDATAILLDAWHPESPGGSGTSFDWQALPPFSKERLVLAGGLSASNVAQAIDVVEPYAVDVSSGIESAPGKKSAEKMYAFSSAVYKAWAT